MARSTVADRLRRHVDSLTRSEAQLSDIILHNYPVSGLGSITALADAANVSSPTVGRLVQKLGFDGFSEFQNALRQELDETISSPLTKRAQWVHDAPEEHTLNRFTKTVIDNISQSLSEMDTKDFDKACELIANKKRRVFIVGGRITRTLADYLFLHLQVIRDGVTHVASNSNAWAHYMLEADKGDVFVIFDIRRYENSTLRLAEMAAERGVKIILFTDQWTSPVAALADITFRNRIAVPSAWDSSVASTLLIEAMIAQVQEKDWDSTQARIEALEEMFDRTRFFRKF